MIYDLGKEPGSHQPGDIYTPTVTAGAMNSDRHIMTTSEQLWEHSYHTMQTLPWREDGILTFCHSCQGLSGHPPPL